MGCEMIKLWNGKEKLFKATLTLVAALLMFIGPTYLLFVLQRLGVPHPLLLLSALASFTAGIILTLYVTAEEKKS